MFIAAEFLFRFRLKLEEARKQTRTILINPTNTRAQILNVQHLLIVIVITFYSPSCSGQETAEGPLGLRVKRPPAHLSTTHGGGFMLSL